MKKPKAKPRAKPLQTPPPKSVDPELVHSRMVAECRLLLVKLEKTRAEWSRHEREDGPGFETWMETHFGPGLNHLEALQKTVAELAALKVELEADLYAAMFPNCFPASLRARRKANSAAGPRTMNQDNTPGPVPRAPGQKRGLKETYRLLLSGAHSNIYSNGDPNLTAPWPKPPTDRARENIELRALLTALAENPSETAFQNICLDQMRAIRAELREECKALGRDLRDAHGQPGWDFARLRDHRTLHTWVQRDLAAAFRSLVTRGRECEKLVARWSANLGMPPNPACATPLESNVPAWWRPLPSF